jgi:DNA processing protein
VGAGVTAEEDLQEHKLEPERLARVTLSRLVEPGDPRVASLVREFGAVSVVDRVRSGRDDRRWSEPFEERLEQIDPAADLERAERLGIRFIVPGDDEWPHQLADLETCRPLHDRGGIPLGLWVKGDVPLDVATSNAIAVVGSRAATAYGDHQAGSLSADLAAAGGTIVSGAAFGIDQAAHRGALTAGGTTIAVLACGVDSAYPTAHAQLLETIAQSGLVISECPPGAAPTRTRFLARNRIAAGLSEGTVVVEAAVRSGALNTARWTSELQRPLMAVPGPVGSAASDGVHQLIRAGQATMVTRAQEILEDLTSRRVAGRRGGVDESYVPNPGRPPEQPRSLHSEPRHRAVPAR